MHCPNCGTSIPEGATFCPECGQAIEAPVPAEQPVPEPAPAPSAPEPAPEPTPAPAPEQAPVPAPAPAASPDAGDVPKKGSRTPLIIAIVAVLAVGGIVGALFATGVIGGKKEAPEASAPASTVTTEPSPQAAGPDESKLFDSNGFVTLYACAELTGDELADVLSDNGYTFEKQGDVKGWNSKDNRMAFMVSFGTDEKWLDEAGLRKIGKGGAGDAVWYELIFEGYDDIEKALSEVGQLTIAKKDATTAKNAYAIAEASDGASFFVNAFIDDDGDVNIGFFNEDGLKAGLLEDYGDSVQSVYESAVAIARGETGTDGNEGTDTPAPTGTDSAELPATATKECYTEDGMITTHAILELSGADLVQTLKALGFVYDASMGGFFQADKSLFVAVLNDEKELSEAEIAKLEKNGGTQAVYYMLQCGPYSTAKEAFDGVNTVVTEDWVMPAKNSGLGVIYGPSMRENLVFVTNGSEDSTSEIFSYVVMTDEAVKAGLFEGVTQHEFGNSIQEVWQTITGGAVGDYLPNHPDE